MVQKAGDRVLVLERAPRLLLTALRRQHLQCNVKPTRLIVRAPYLSLPARAQSLHERVACIEFLAQFCINSLGHKSSFRDTSDAAARATRGIALPRCRTTSVPGLPHRPLAEPLRSETTRKAPSMPAHVSWNRNTSSIPTKSTQRHQLQPPCALQLRVAGSCSHTGRTAAVRKRSQLSRLHQDRSASAPDSACAVPSRSSQNSHGATVHKRRSFHRRNSRSSHSPYRQRPSPVRECDRCEY